MPKTIVIQPNILPKIAICVGLFAHILAMELGIISKEFINKIPTKRIATTKIKEINKIKIHLILFSLMPSVTANSL
jgi:hypothetical protein